MWLVLLSDAIIPGRLLTIRRGECRGEGGSRMRLASRSLASLGLLYLFQGYVQACQTLFGQLCIRWAYKLFLNNITSRRMCSRNRRTVPLRTVRAGLYTKCSEGIVTQLTLAKRAERGQRD
ncbi:unnamed protein product [Ixodes pacificus]